MSLGVIRAASMIMDETCRTREVDQKGTQNFNPLNAQLNPVCHLLALLGTHHILHVSRIGVNWKT